MKYIPKKAAEYAAVIQYRNVAFGDGIAVQEYFYTIREAEAWIAKQKHDPINYEWKVMKYA